MNVKNFIRNLACIFTVAFMVGCSAFNDDSDPYGVGEATKETSFCIQKRHRHYK